MKFAITQTTRNLVRRPARSLLLAFLVALLSFFVLTGACATSSLRQGLNSYRARLGADIVVVPSSAAGHGAVDQILLEGIAGNYYMDAKKYEKIAAVEGIERITRQFYLTSAKASCCSARVQIIGFEPETDFVIMPWIRDSFAGEIADGCAVAGAGINVPGDGVMTFYGHAYRVAAQLEQTGTGLDNAVYVNMNTMREMAASAARLLETSPFRGVDLDTASSAVFIKVAEGRDIADVTDYINVKISKVEATPARSMVSGIADGLDRVTGIIRLLVAAVWLLAVIVLAVAFALSANERRREFAILRVMGASRGLLAGITALEAGLISALGAILGIGLGLLAISRLSDLLQSALSLPFLRPGAGRMAALCLAALALSMVAGLLAAFAAAFRTTRGDTGLLIREGA